MKQGFTLRNIRGEDFIKVLELWNETNPFDPIDRMALKRKVFLDVNFEPEGFFLTEEEDTLWGFIYVVRRLVPIDAGGSMDTEKLWINALGYLPDAPEGVGEALLAAAEEYAHKVGAKKLIATSYTPNYFTQGIDTVNYPQYAALLEDAGFKGTAPTYSMDLDLSQYFYSRKLKLRRSF